MLEVFWPGDDVVEIELVDIALETTLLDVEFLWDELIDATDDIPDESLVSDSPDEPQAASIDSIKIENECLIKYELFIMESVGYLPSPW